MKVYVLEFRYFDGCEWKDVNKEITATSMFQLIRTFIEEISFISEQIWSEEMKDFRLKTTRDVWNEHKKYIEIKELTFPIVKTN